MVCVRSLVPKLKNSASRSHLVGQQRRARDLDHGADQVLLVLHAGLFEDFVRHALHDRLLILQFLHAEPISGIMTSGMTFLPFLAT